MRVSILAHEPRSVSDVANLAVFVILRLAEGSFNYMFFRSFLSSG